MKHKNVCQFKRCFQGSRHVYILLELCSGGTLQHFIRNRKRLSESEAAQVMLQLVHAVDYLHSQLVIHCDIKPHNILLSPNGQVKLADFGLSYRLKHSQQKCNRSCGTPNYVAPEAIARKRHHCQIGLQADIWSLGCVLYSMLVGVPPFEAETTKETYKRIRACHYEFPSNVALSPQARDLIRSMLQADPNKRYVVMWCVRRAFTFLLARCSHPFIRSYVLYAAQHCTRFVNTGSFMFNSRFLRTLSLERKSRVAAMQMRSSSLDDAKKSRMRKHVALEASRRNNSYS